MGKLVRRIEAFFRRPRYLNPKINSQNCLHVLEIESDCDSLIDALGITKERQRELTTLVLSQFNKQPNIVKVAEICSKECKHANELFMITYLISIRQDELSNPLLRMFR
jgi:hypothetical protein